MDESVGILFESVMAIVGFSDNPAIFNGGLLVVLLVGCVVGFILCWFLMPGHRKDSRKESADHLPGVMVQLEKTESGWQMTTLSKSAEAFSDNLGQLPPNGVPTPLALIFDKAEARTLSEVLDTAYRLRLPVNHECRLNSESPEIPWVCMKLSYAGFLGKHKLNGLIIDVTDRKTMERELLEDKQFAEQLLESSGVIFSVCDKNGKLIRANRKYYDISGYTPDEIYFNAAELDLLGDSFDSIKDVFRRVLEGNDPIINENPWYCRDGSIKTIRWMNTGMKNSEGELAYVISVGTDITDLRTMEKQLNGKIEEFTALFDNTLVGMALIEGSRIVKANQVCADMLGYSAEEIDNLSMERMFADKAGYEEFQGDVCPKIYKGLRHFDYEFRRKNGKQAEFRVSASPVPGVNHGDRLLLVLDDISESKMVERALLRSETRFRTIIDKMASGLALINESGYFEEVNDSWCRITGYTREDARKLTVLDITLQDDMDVSVNTMSALLADATEMKRMEKRYIKKDGSIIWIDLTASKIDERGNNGRVTLLSIINDISERKAIEEELKQTNLNLEAEKNNVQELADQRMAVFELFDTIRESRDIEDLLGILKNNLSRFVNYRDLMAAIRISRVDPRYVIRDMQNESSEADVLELLETGKGIIGSVVRSRQLYMAKDVLEDPNFIRHHPDVRSYMAFPIIYKDFVWGVIGLDHFDVGHFTGQDAEILTMVGTLIAMQMEEMTAKMALHQESDRLRILHDMVQHMARARNNSDILELICTSNLFPSTHVYRINPDGGFSSCACSACAGGSMPDLTELYDYKNGKPIVWERAEEKYRYNVAIGVRFNTEYRGILHVSHELEFTEAEVELVSILAEQIAVFLELNRIIAQRESEAMIDPLTGVWNRRYMIERLEQEEERIFRYGGSACVAILDMGDFKLINDKYGHVKGDEVLIAVAKEIEGSIRKTDFVGRYGGDEFVLFLPNTEQAEAELLLEKLRKNVQAVCIEGIRQPIEIDAGLAVFPGEDASLIGAIRIADEKMYLNKRERKRMSLFQN